MEEIFTKLYEIWKTDDTEPGWYQKIEKTENWMDSEISQWISQKHYRLEPDDYYYILKKKFTPETIKIEKPYHTTFKQHFYFLTDLLDLISCDFDLNQCEVNWVSRKKTYFTFNKNIRFHILKNEN